MQPHRSSATLLALIFALLILYASLYPFSGWRDQGINPFFFLNAPWPRYWSRFDIVANFVGYMPLGFLTTLALLRTSLLPQPVFIAAVGCALFSLSLEALQSYLPLRVPQLSDLLLNSAGGLAGAIVAVLLERLGALDRWSRFRARWFVRDARAPLVLLALWPAALLFPPAVPLALGQVRVRLHGFINELAEGTPFAPLIDEPSAYLLPFTSLGELICVALGFVIPCLLSFAITQGWQRRILLWISGMVIALGASSLSAAMSYSPEHAWGWLSFASEVGLAVGMIAALLCIALPRKLCLGLLVAALVWQLSLVNSAPETPYFAQTLQSWEQGSFIRFHGLAQWLGWLWPYAALLVALIALSRRDASMRR
jgi:VanZ family protein